MFIGSKQLLLELVEGRPCPLCCSPLTLESSTNLGTALSIVTVCKYGHQSEWNSSEPNKERTHCAADFDLSSATIMAKSTSAKLFDTLEICGFKKMSTTVFNAAQNQLNEVAKAYKVFDDALTMSKIQMANGNAAPEFELDTAYHTRVNSWTAATTIQEARTKLVAWSELEVTGEGVSSQQLEKLGVGKGLPAVIEKYGGCSSVTSDSCGSLLKQVKGIVQELLDKGECEQLRDIWHQQKGIFTKWGNYVDSKWGALPAMMEEPSEKFPKGRRIPNKMADIQEHSAQRKEMKKLARWMQGRFTFTIDHANQDVGIAKEIWQNATAHLSGDHSHCRDWAEDQDCSESTIRLRSPRMVEVTRMFLAEKDMVDDFEAYRTDRSTSHIESFKIVLAAFADKRVFFNIEALKLRHILAVLSWNESRGRELIGRFATKVGPGNSWHKNRTMRNRYAAPVHAWKRNLMRNFRATRPMKV